MIEGNTIYMANHTIPVGETYRDTLFRLVREKE